MLKSNLSAETQQYLELFYEPRISAYEFFKLFFAILYRRGVKEVTRDFTEFLYKEKKKDSFRDILREIKFKNNGIYYYSNQIEDSIFNLQNVGLIGKENPSFGKILLKYNELVVADILSNFERNDIELVESIVNDMASQDEWGDMF